MRSVIGVYFSPLRSRAFWAAVALASAAAGSAFGAAPPEYTVANKQSRFTVADKTQPATCICGAACKCAPGKCPGSCPVASAAPGWSVTGHATAAPPGCRWAYWAPLGQWAWVHESLLPKVAPADVCPPGG